MRPFGLSFGLSQGRGALPCAGARAGSASSWRDNLGTNCALRSPAAGRGGVVCVHVRASARVRVARTRLPTKRRGFHAQNGASWLSAGRSGGRSGLISYRGVWPDCVRSGVFFCGAKRRVSAPGRRTAWVCPASPAPSDARKRASPVFTRGNAPIRFSRAKTRRFAPAGTLHPGDHQPGALGADHLGGLRQVRNGAISRAIKARRRGRAGRSRGGARQQTAVGVADRGGRVTDRRTPA